MIQRGHNITKSIKKDLIPVQVTFQSELSSDESAIVKISAVSCAQPLITHVLV